MTGLEAKFSYRMAAAMALVGIDTGAIASFSDDLAGSDWVPVPHGPTQAVARDAELLKIAAGATMYPDHLIFLGPGVAIARAGEGPEEASARVAATGPARKLVLLPGRGAAIPADASPSMVALGKALGDVLLRVDADALIARLTPAEEAELLNWDAEKYRQALEAERQATA